jgi:predicted dehydrogenase
MRRFESKYGYFDEAAREYVITSPHTPRPWVNVICPGDWGVILSQTGGGYSWRTHASLNAITRWSQDIVCDGWGKYIYVRDDLGDPLWAMYTYPLWRVDDPGWKFKEDGCRGIVVENMVHAIDALRYLAGDIARVYAEGDNFIFTDAKPPDSAIIALRFCNGAIGGLGGGCTSDRRISKEYLDIHYEHGIAQISGRLDQPYHLSLLLRDATGVEQYFFDGSDGVAEEVQHFVECVQRGEQPLCTGSDGRKAVQVALAIIESIRCGSPIAIA